MKNTCTEYVFTANDLEIKLIDKELIGTCTGNQNNRDSHPYKLATLYSKNGIVFEPKRVSIKGNLQFKKENDGTYLYNENELILKLLSYPRSGPNGKFRSQPKCGACQGTWKKNAIEEKEEKKKKIEKRLANLSKTSSSRMSKKVKQNRDNLIQRSLREWAIAQYGKDCIRGQNDFIKVDTGHIVPEKECNYQQKIDPENILLLTANDHRYYDADKIIFLEDGSIWISKKASEFLKEEMKGITSLNCKLTDRMKNYIKLRNKLKKIDIRKYNKL
jgi:hypothetical protein